MLYNEDFHLPLCFSGKVAAWRSTHWLLARTDPLARQVMRLQGRQAGRRFHALFMQLGVLDATLFDLLEQSSQAPLAIHEQRQARRFVHYWRTNTAFTPQFHLVHVESWFLLILLTITRSAQLVQSLEIPTFPFPCEVRLPFCIVLRTPHDGHEYMVHIDLNISALSPMDNVLGWQPGCNTRGTWDIIWTCTQTIALCAWVAVCPNIPAPDHGPWALYIDKFYFFLLTLLGPEFIFFLAFGQFQSAVTSRKLFHEMGYMDWSLTHGFYADMGGIHVQPSGWKRFPVNSRQLHYLIKRGYMEYPKIAKKDIFAAGKIDGLARYRE